MSHEEVTAFITSFLFVETELVKSCFGKGTGEKCRDDKKKGLIYFYFKSSLSIYKISIA